jgi:hypothetical protein
MKIRVLTALALLIGACTLQAQQSGQADADLQQMKQQLQEVVASLQQTRGELRESQQKIEDLQSQVASLRQQVAGGAPGLSSSPASNAQDQLATLQQQQQLLTTRVDQQYQTKVESGSKYRVRLSGLVLFNASTTRGAVNDQDVPMLAEAHAPGASGGDISATMRQTLVNVDVFGPELAGAKTSAQMQFDFFGGFPNTVDGVAMGIARLRVGRAQFDWDKWSLTIGQDKPFISPNSPSSLAAIGTPEFGYSGNLWTWTPQAVVERRWTASENLGAKLQFGVLDPFSGELPRDSFERYPEPGEASRTPAFSARQSFDFGSGTQKSTIGVGSYFARHEFSFNRVVDGWAGSFDWNVLLGKYFETSGLLYRGQALGGLWGGIGTTAVFDGNPNDPRSHIFAVNTVGGWSQLKYKPAAKWEINGGFGEDSPFASNVRHFNEGTNYTPYLRNWTAMFNIIQRPRSNLILSLEYRHLNSVEFSGKRESAEHVNLGVGVRF